MASMPEAKGASCSSTLRKPWEGTAMKTIPTPETASSRDAVTASASGRATPGR